jgi:hypothetical protein
MFCLDVDYSLLQELYFYLLLLGQLGELINGLNLHEGSTLTWTLPYENLIGVQVHLTLWHFSLQPIILLVQGDDFLLESGYLLIILLLGVSQLLDLLVGMLERDVEQLYLGLEVDDLVAHDGVLTGRR